jgi:hypothetical protein
MSFFSLRNKKGVTNMENQNLPQTGAVDIPEKKAQIKEADQEINKVQASPTYSASQPPVQYYSAYVPKSKTAGYISFKNRVTSPKGLIVTVLSILLCILFTETILLGSAGISVPVFAIAFYGVLFYFFREVGNPICKAAMFLTIPVLLLAFSFFIHYNPSTQFITWCTIIGIICIQLILLSDIKVSGIFTFDMLAKTIINLIGKPFSNLSMPFLSFGILKGNKSRKFKNSIYILIGLAVSLPIAAILMSLFVRADAVFADAMNTLYNYIGLDFANLFSDIFIGSTLGLFLASMLLGLKYEEKTQKSYSKIGNNVESIIIGTFLTIIDIFLIAFVAFQFVYLFGGTVNISKMSYAEYARRGFFELSTASGIIFTIALFVIIMAKKRNGRLTLWIQLTTVCLCVCNGVLLISAVKRMLLYVNIYGLSVKRVLTLWFMGIIGLCLLWIIAKCFINKIDVMKWLGLTVIIGVCIISLTNTERIIAKYNVDRYLSSPTEASIDLYYLGQLSYTAVPEIQRLKEADKQNPYINDLFAGQNTKFKHRHMIYGFTLDSIEAGRILDSELK